MSDPDNIPDPVQLRSLAQNDYNIDGNLLPDGVMLCEIADRIEQTQALLVKRAMNKEQEELIRFISEYGCSMDNDGQLVIYTSLMYDENGNIVPFKHKDEDNE